MSTMTRCLDLSREVSNRSHTSSSSSRMTPACMTSSIHSRLKRDRRGMYFRKLEQMLMSCTFWRVESSRYTLSLRKESSFWRDCSKEASSTTGHSSWWRRVQSISSLRHLVFLKHWLKKEWTNYVRSMKSLTKSSIDTSWKSSRAIKIYPWIMSWHCQRKSLINWLSKLERSCWREESKILKHNSIKQSNSTLCRLEHRWMKSRSRNWRNKSWDN